MDMTSYSFQEVRNMRGIGQRLADKIWEIHESGELRKADEFLRDDKVQTMNLFTNIHGVGPTIAEHWYQQVSACLMYGEVQTVVRVGYGYSQARDVEALSDPTICFQMRLAMRSVSF